MRLTWLDSVVYHVTKQALLSPVLLSPRALALEVLVRHPAKTKKPEFYLVAIEAHTVQTHIHEYRYHHPGYDSRLALLPHDLIGSCVLDTGRKEGWVPLAAQSWRPRRRRRRQVVGVDIDDVLVRMAWGRRHTFVARFWTVLLLQHIPL
ncbi:hypothetical protein EDB85DRAFT_2280183 [Lactarius pseudohatsudake]|nr:hypothetical protein EDB85DRAFT_2280183 [Lactarius pseudohatsudake]